jgi:thymidylate synthase (FAD)
MKEIQVELQESMGSDKSIANSAWTSSFNKEIRGNKTDEDVKRIVNMLADSKHSVPFESVVFRFWIKMPIFIDRQHMTHRIASHSGLSGRYRTMLTQYYDLPDDVHDILIKINLESEMEKYIESCEIATNNYTFAMNKLKEAKKNGIITELEFKRCREILRGQLPLANMTERTTVINLRSFANYYKLRNKDDAQKEIQFIANQMLEQIKQSNICPIAIEALERNNWTI